MSDMSAEDIKVLIYRPSAEMMMSPYKWKILEWDEFYRDILNVKRGFGLKLWCHQWDLPHLVALYDKQEVLRTQFNQDTFRTHPRNDSYDYPTNWENAKY